MSRNPVRLSSILLLLLAACFEDPVAEHLQLEFLKDETVAVSLKIDITVPEDNKNRFLGDRIQELRERLLRGEDEWTRRFERVTPVNETISLHKTNAHLTGVEHRARINADDLQRFFSDTSLTLAVVHGSDFSELIVYPGVSRRATAQQKSLLSGRLDSWSAAISAYLGGLAGVYAYLERHPDRAEAVLGDLLKDEMEEAERSRLPQVSDEEQTVLNALTDQMSEVWSVLTVEDDQAFSINEISGLVHDPFPASLTVRLPRMILEHEGFGKPVDQSVRMQQRTLWAALAGLSNRWITPDPLVMKIETSRSAGAQKVNLPAFLAQPRRVVRVPSPAEVKAALDEALKPRPLYRVRWASSESPVPSPQSPVQGN